MGLPINASYIKAYTDGSSFGSSKKHPKIAGWSLTTEVDGREINVMGHLEEPSNSQIAELLAVAYAIAFIGKRGERAVVYTDSQYAERSLNEWRHSWAVKGMPEKNRELLDLMFRAQDKFPNVRVQKVKGHAGNAGNDKADMLAKAARDKKLGLFESIKFGVIPDKVQLIYNTRSDAVNFIEKLIEG